MTGEWPLAGMKAALSAAPMTSYPESMRAAAAGVILKGLGGAQ